MKSLLKNVLITFCVLVSTICGASTHIDEIDLLPSQTEKQPVAEQIDRTNKEENCKDKSRKDKSCKKKIKLNTVEIKNLKAKEIQVEQLEAENADFNGTVTFEGNVIDAIGGTYFINSEGTGDFPTIQAALDLVNSGLKPNSDVIFDIAAGTYVESLLVDTDFMNPGLNGLNTDLPNIRTRCLKLRGDKRVITCMTYMKGGLLRRPGQSTLLGGSNGIVDVIHANNIITVTSTIAPNPDFVASGIVPGDTVIITNNDGTVQERTVRAIGFPLAANQIEINDPVIISGNGAALTFCPNVKVIGSIPDVILHVAGGAVQVEGIWFSSSTAPVPFAYGILVQNTGALYIDRLLLDTVNQPAFDSIGIDSGAYIDATAADFVRAGLVTVIGGNIADFINGYIGGNGEWYIITAGTPVFSVAINNGIWNSNSYQVCGANKRVSGMFVSGSGISVRIGIYSAFNCNNGITIPAGGNTVLINQVIRIENCNTGINIADGSKLINSGAGLFAGLTQSITNCTTGINLNAATSFETTRPFQIDNCTNGIIANLDSRFDTAVDLTLNSITTGITLRTGSAFTSQANVLFNNVANPYAIDESSDFLTPNNAGTNPSPSDIFTYTTAGVGQPMNSAYLKQLLDSPGSVGLVLDPALSIGGTPIHRGKIYTLGAVTAGPHTLTLVGGATFVQGGNTRTFTGIGSTLVIEVISNTQVLILSSSGIL